MEDRETLRAALRHGLRDGRVLVVGDVMLDRFVWGGVRRVSPEAPVPVVLADRQSEAAGGAGNVARNLSGLGAPCSLVGVVGRDPDGDRVRALLHAAGIDVGGVRAVAGRPTTTKVRILGGHQQIVRLDTEDASPLDGAAERAVLDALAAALERGPAAVVLSDYAKGVLTPAVCRAAIEEARERRIPVIVDPKGGDGERYRGATAMTPNRAELGALAGDLGAGDDDALRAAAEGIRDRWALEFVVLTLGARGMMLCDRDGAWPLPTVAREVFDVSGAGDTVVAVLAAGLAAGLPRREAVTLANLAAGVVVGKIGTAPIELAELAAAVLGAGGAVESKIRTLDDLRELVQTWRQGRQRIVFTNGCYDLLHAGHVIGLQRARECGDRLVVGVNTDDSVRRLKGSQRPWVPLEQRLQVLAGLAAVDAVVPFAEDTPIALIEALRPDVLAKGADYEEHEIVGAPEVRSWGGRVARIPLVEGLSTTALIARIGQERGEDGEGEGEG